MKMDTTRWSLVLEARDRADGSAAREALAALCEIYWMPVYSYVRYRGYGAEEAKDLTQEFFTVLIEKHYLKNVRPEKGRFRNFLLTAVKNFAANEWRKEQAQKRGGGQPVVSLDVGDVENQVRQDATGTKSPEDIYHRNWALALLGRAYDRLCEENNSPKRKERFDLLKGYITSGHQRLPYAELEGKLGDSADALKVHVHRLRKRYGTLIREEIAQTVETEEAITAELRELLSALD